MARKINLEEEALESAAGARDERLITEEDLMDLCPKTIFSKFKKADTAAKRADLLFTIKNGELAELRKVFQEMETFVSKLSAWFIQELTATEGQTGISGKVGRVEIKKKELNGVDNWEDFWEYVRKKKAYDLVQRRLSDKAVADRLEQGITIPGVYTFEKNTVSITGVKNAS